MIWWSKIAFICHSLFFFNLVSWPVFIFLILTFLKSRGPLFCRISIWLVCYFLIVDSGSGFWQEQHISAAVSFLVPCIRRHMFMCVNIVNIGDGDFAHLGVTWSLCNSQVSKVNKWFVKRYHATYINVLFLNKLSPTTFIIFWWVSVSRMIDFYWLFID